MSLNTSTSLNKTTLPLSQTDPEAAKQQSTANKLELFEIIKAMQDGRLPHNDQLDSLLERLISNRVIRSREHKMSPDGKNLLNDFRDLLETLRKTLRAKNKEELFQSYVYHLHCMDIPISRNAISGSANESDKNAVKQEGKKGSQALYNVGKLVLLNNEFRSLLGELLDIGQNVFNNVTDQIGEDLKQKGDKLSDGMNTDESGKEKVDNLILGNQQNHAEPHLIDENATDPTHAGLLNTGDSVHPHKLFTQYDNPNQLSQPNMESFSSHQLNQSQFNQPQLNQGSSYGVHDKEDQYKNNAQQQAEGYKDKARQNLEHHKQGVNQNVHECFDEDKQDELLDRLRAAISQVQRHPQYQEAISTLSRLVKSWSSRLTKITGNVKEHAQSQDSNEQASYRDQAEMELKTLIEGWAQGRSIDPILEGVQIVMKDAKNDDNLRQYYDTALMYVQRLLRDPDYINSDESTEHGKQLIDIGRQLMNGKYGEHYQYLSDNIRGYMHLMSDDHISRELNERFTQIHQDLWMDSEGNPAFKPQLLNDMRKTLLPAFIDEIKFIPVPRIEYSDKQFDIIVENLVVSGESLLPNIFDVKAENFSSFNLNSDEDTRSSHQSLLIHMSEIQADINDVVFCYSKKTGFPKIKDRGVASLDIDRKGISIVVRVQSTNNPAKTFKVTYCKCHVDHIKMKVNESNHDILYKAVLPLVTGTIRKQVARAIEMKIIETLNNVDQKITTSLVNMNQNLQNKAYEALPESDKTNPNVQPEQVSTARPRPGLLSTLVTIINRNIKAKTENRNIEKKYKKSKESPAASMQTDRYHALASNPNKENTPYSHELHTDKLKEHPDISSTLASSSLNNQYTNIPSNDTAIGSNVSMGDHSTGYGAGAPNQSLSGNHPISSNKPITMENNTDRLMNTRGNPVYNQSTDSMMAEHGSSNNASLSTFDSNNLRHEPRHKNLNDEYMQSNPLSANSNDMSQIPHPSAPISEYNTQPNNSFAKPSMTGDRNTQLSHGDTINQDSRLAQRGFENNGNPFTSNTLGSSTTNDGLKQSTYTNPNGLESNFSHPTSVSNPVFDNNNQTAYQPTTTTGMDQNSSGSPTLINSNGIDNQHFKLAMDLSEAQNPAAPPPPSSRQNVGNLERTRQI